MDKINVNSEDIILTEEENMKDAQIVMISYGITSRVALKAIQMAKKKKINHIGQLRLKTIWPFPEKRIREIAKSVKAFVVPEMNYGQMVLEVERCAGGKCKTILVPHGGGTVHDPEVILKAIEEAYQ
jgi:2-oxoglutarate ferredoxin oxidoreductase subunit alpha